MESQNLGRIVRYHRDRAGLSRKHLAAIAGVGKTVIYDIEHGKETVQLRSLLRVLQALNISMQVESPLMEGYHTETNEGNS
jgi:y4mF family transcriptional regulator